MGPLGGDPCGRPVAHPWRPSRLHALRPAGRLLDSSTGEGLRQAIRWLRVSQVRHSRTRPAGSDWSRRAKCPAQRTVAWRRRSSIHTSTGHHGKRKLIFKSIFLKMIEEHSFDSRKKVPNTDDPRACCPITRTASLDWPECAPRRPTLCPAAEPTPIWCDCAVLGQVANGAASGVEPGQNAAGNGMRWANAIGSCWLRDRNTRASFGESDGKIVLLYIEHVHLTFCSFYYLFFTNILENRLNFFINIFCTAWPNIAIILFLLLV